MDTKKQNDDVESEKGVTYLEKVDSDGNTNLDDSIEYTDATLVVWLVTFTVSMGGFFFGYDTGVISAVLVNLGTDLGHRLSSNEQELVISLTSGGALIGALIAGLPADRYGRKLGIYMGCALFLIGSAVQASSFTVAQMGVGRFVVGLGVGSAAMIVPLYIGEISPARYRGRMIALDNVSVTLGQLISYSIGAGLTHVDHGWRYMVAIGGVPPIILAALLPKCPHSPHQLVSHRRIEEARSVVKRIYPNATGAQITSKTDRITFTVEQENEAVSDRSLWWQYKRLHTDPANFRALVCVCTVMASVSQLSGFNTLMYYSATLFALVGFAQATSVGATNFVFNIVNLVAIDRFGRRKVLLITILGMVFSLVVAAVAFHFIPISKDLTVESTTVNWAGILLLVTIIVYIANFSSGVATIAWVGTELMPLEVRALGTMLNSVTCWGCNLIISSTFLSMMKAMTPNGTFAFYTAICSCGWLFVLFAYPEVKGLPLEEVRQIFNGGFGVKEANALQKQKRAH